MKKLLTKVLAFVSLLCFAIPFAACGDSAGDETKEPISDEMPIERTDFQTLLVVDDFCGGGCDCVVVQTEEALGKVIAAYPGYDALSPLEGKIDFAEKTLLLCRFFYFEGEKNIELGAYKITNIEPSTSDKCVSLIFDMESTAERDGEVKAKLFAVTIPKTEGIYLCSSTVNNLLTGDHSGGLAGGSIRVQSLDEAMNGNFYPAFLMKVPTTSYFYRSAIIRTQEELNDWTAGYPKLSYVAGFAKYIDFSENTLIIARVGHSSCQYVTCTGYSVEENGITLSYDFYNPDKSGLQTMDVWEDLFILSVPKLDETVTEIRR